MKPKAISHEVLLLTSTHFSKRQFFEKNDNHSANSFENQLQKACWNGLVFEILPDIVKCPSQKTGSYTWEVMPAENFIEVKIGEAPLIIENEVSVNPYFFLFQKNFN